MIRLVTGYWTTHREVIAQAACYKIMSTLTSSPIIFLGHTVKSVGSSSDLVEQKCNSGEGKGVESHCTRLGAELVK
jgi:hypothetical protein